VYMNARLSDTELIRCALLCCVVWCCTSVTPWLKIPPGDNLAVWYLVQVMVPVLAVKMPFVALTQRSVTLTCLAGSFLLTVCAWAS
jgi:hypothetical protein